MKNSTKVIFRKCNDGDILSVFPEIASNYAKDLLCYQHIGQHGSCTWSYVLSDSKPCTDSEYKPLLDELISRGYSNLQVVKRNIYNPVIH